MLYFFQEKIIFLPEKMEQNHQVESKFAYEEIYLTNPKDSATLHAFFYQNENPKGVILYFHGNQGNLVRWSKIGEYFVEMGYDLFIMDYRGYGKSTGKFSEESMYEDAQLCYDFVSKRYHPQDITLYGRSLGTSFASYVAGNNAAKRVILETPFYSLNDLVKTRFPLLPMRNLLNYTFPSYQYLAKSKMPIYIFQGDNDQVVPLASASKLHQYLEQKKHKVEFILIPGGAHNDLIDFEIYHQAIANILSDSIN